MRQIQELQARIEHLQRGNDQLRSLEEKILELGKDVRDGNCVRHLIVCYLSSRELLDIRVHAARFSLVNR